MAIFAVVLAWALLAPPRVAGGDRPLPRSFPTHACVGPIDRGTQVFIITGGALVALLFLGSPATFSRRRQPPPE